MVTSTSREVDWRLRRNSQLPTLTKNEISNLARNTPPVWRKDLDPFEKNRRNLFLSWLKDHQRWWYDFLSEDANKIACHYDMYRPQRSKWPKGTVPASPMYVSDPGPHNKPGTPGRRPPTIRKIRTLPMLGGLFGGIGGGSSGSSTNHTTCMTSSSNALSNGYVTGPTVTTGTTTNRLSWQTWDCTANSLAHILYFAQGHNQVELIDAIQDILQNLKIEHGHESNIELPDGTFVHVDKDGSYRIEDSQAKVIYKAEPARDFNVFMNASDRLEDFVRFCGQHGVTQDEMMHLPINLFVGWLVLEAAKADREPEPDDINLIPDLRRIKKPRCISCGRFITKAKKVAKVEYCSTKCFEAQMALAA